jgi:hypothetical protein
MGYYVVNTGSNFKIKFENIQKAFEAIKNVKGKNFWWVKDSFRDAENFTDIMRHWRWEVEFDKDSNVVNIKFIGTKLGHDLLLFKTIAPYVEENSTIDMEGDDGLRWTWKFTPEGLKRITR